MIPQRMPGRENAGSAVGYRVAACRRRLRIMHAINRDQARMDEDVREITLFPAGIDVAANHPSLSCLARIHSGGPCISFASE